MFSYPTSATHLKMPRSLLLKKFKTSDERFDDKTYSVKKNENKASQSQQLAKDDEEEKVELPVKRLIESCKGSFATCRSYSNDEDCEIDYREPADNLSLQSAHDHSIEWTQKGDTTVKIWVCGKCKKEFTHHYTLIRHLPMHTNERKYICSICKKSFRQASTMSRHKAVHSNDRPFVCDICGKGFNRQSTLIVHRKTHTKEKIHACKICGKGFHQKGNLKNHLYTHTGERPYKCDICNRGFNQMSNLMCHKAHAHVEKPKFKCQLCDLEFSRKFSLRTHEEYKHGSNGKQFLVVNGDNGDVEKKSGRPLNSARTITLPNGDKTIKFSEGIKEKLLQKVMRAKTKRKSRKTHDTSSIMNEKGSKNASRKKLKNNNSSYVSSKDLRNANSNKKEKYLKSTCNKHTITLSKNEEHVYHSSGILIPRIQSKRLMEAKRNGQTLFAFLKPLNGIPALVKVLEAHDNTHILVPTTADDLKTGGEITVSSPARETKNKVKAVHVKVPIIATIVHKTTSAGELLLEILPHDEIEDSVENENCAAVVSDPSTSSKIVSVIQSANSAISNFGNKSIVALNEMNNQ